MISPIVIENFFDEEELLILHTEFKKNKWRLDGGTLGPDRKDFLPVIFWHKELITTKITELFKQKIELHLKKKIKIEQLYANGQAHGQCGNWHKDYDIANTGRFTIVYFAKEWKPEYGGHLIIKGDGLISVLPEKNKGVLFDSTLDHIGLEPTRHCYTQRESIACKFQIIEQGKNFGTYSAYH